MIKELSKARKSEAAHRKQEKQHVDSVLYYLKNRQYHQAIEALAWAYEQGTAADVWGDVARAEEKAPNHVSAELVQKFIEKAGRFLTDSSLTDMQHLFMKLQVEAKKPKPSRRRLKT